MTVISRVDFWRPFHKLFISMNIYIMFWHSRVAGDITWVIERCISFKLNQIGKKSLDSDEEVFTPRALCNLWCLNLHLWAQGRSSVDNGKCFMLVAEINWLNICLKQFRFCFSLLRVFSGGIFDWAQQNSRVRRRFLMKLLLWAM